jgi:hypothetical protein
VNDYVLPYNYSYYNLEDQLELLSRPRTAATQEALAAGALLVHAGDPKSVLYANIVPHA